VEGKRPSNATVALDLAILSASFGRLVRLGVLDANPCARVRRPKGRESVRVALNEGETEALLRACSPQVRPLVLGALTTGARFSELAGLRWTDVDLVSGCVRVFRKKNGSADTLPLHPALAESLKALREARAAAGNRTIPSMEPLFLNSKGGPMKDPGPDWHRALEDAGLAHRPGVDFHCLRTTFASSFLGVGGAVSDLRSVLGHRSLAVTERYVRALDSRTRASVYRLRFGGAEGGVVRAIQDAVRTQCVPATGTDGPVGGMALSMGGSQVPVPSGDTAAFPPLREAG
jgi:integrase